jgi:2-polyprenyl-3-methyl-5-hydroxy-6-metoxy-1,4-benzoquinol methylase
MADLRERVYQRYVTTLKAPAAVPPGGRGFGAWCEENYLPLLGGIDRAAQILELGCGSGELLEFLRRSGFAAARGVDLSPEQIAIAQGKQLDARVMDARDALREAEGELDAVLAIDLIEHFPRDEVLELLEQILAGLRPGGRLLLRTPNGGALLGGHVIYGDLTHLTILAPSSLRQLLLLVGFDGITIRACPPAHGTVRGRVRAPLWGAISRVASAMHRIETGKQQSVWTESMLCGCLKPR